MDRMIVKELIQDELTVSNLETELKKILTPETASKMKTDYAELKNILSKGGDASSKAAESIYKFLTHS